jgi:hypothetical protein
MNTYVNTIGKRLTQSMSAALERELLRSDY